MTRLRWVLTGALLLLLGVELCAAVVRQSRFVWNEIRLSRSIALWHGFPLYPGRDEMGPVIGTLHTPISHYIYLIVSGFSSPTNAILAGSLFCFVLVFLALMFTWVRSEDPWRVTAISLCVCLFLILETPSVCAAVFMIHVDAAGLALATVACGVLCDRKRPISARQVWVSGVACVLAISCKQTFAPIALGVLLFLAVADKWRNCLHFICAGAVSGTLLLATCLAAFPRGAFLFNTVTLAAHRPLKAGYAQAVIAGVRDARLDALPAVLPMVFLAAYSYLRLRPPVRVFAASHRWLVFVFASAALLPVSLKALATVGSDVNHLGAVVYFLFVAASLAIQQSLCDPVNRVLRLSAGVFAGAAILVSLAPGMLYELVTDLSGLRTNAPESAYRYELHHPGLAYFPWNPMASLMISGKLYHLDNALFDREAAGYPLTAAQVQSGLPPGFQLVAIPPGEHVMSAAIGRIVAGATQRDDPELPGWTVYEMRR